METITHKQITNLLSQAELQNLADVKLELDSDLKKLCTKINLHAHLLVKGAAEVESHRIPVIDMLQQPVWGYFDSKKVFRVFCGLNSFSLYCKNRPDVVPAFVFNKKPKKAFRDMVVLNELTNALLEQRVFTEPYKIHELLCKWFNTDTRGIFNEPKWSLLYPGLTNKNALCDHFGISSKSFRSER
jgi:mRNA-degrading endonuclease YafQ of YafQ-DinJ toxin-antitoxin module